MKVNLTLFILASLLLPLGFPPVTSGATEDPLIQTLDTGSIDWRSGAVKGRGIATPIVTDGNRLAKLPSDTLNAARQTAQSNLLETIGAIRINAYMLVSDRMKKNHSFREGLKSLAQNASLTRQEYLSDGTVEIELTMPLTGGFAQFVLPEDIQQVDSVTTVATRKKERTQAPDRGPAAQPYTGLILDARGIDVIPSLVPKVVDGSGAGVYGPAFVSREFAVSRGMCGYAATLAAARNDKRVGNRPLVIKAIETRYGGHTDLVISSADAAKLRSSVVHLNFLKACRVSIVMDRQP